MTRINLVPPDELTDQHLFAEWREIKMIPKSLGRSIRARGVDGVLAMVPSTYRLNQGHVSFFYDKGKYLIDRYALLTAAVEGRGYAIDTSSKLDPDGNLQRDSRFLGDYEPDEAALSIIRERIAIKIALRPNWYRYFGIPLPDSFIGKVL